LTTLLSKKRGRTHNAPKVADRIGAIYAQTTLSVPELPKNNTHYVCHIIHIKLKKKHENTQKTLIK